MDFKGRQIGVGNGAEKLRVDGFGRDVISECEREQENIGYRWIGREEIWEWEREQENIGYRWIGRDEIWECERGKENIGYR